MYSKSFLFVLLSIWSVSSSTIIPSSIDGSSTTPGNAQDTQEQTVDPPKKILSQYPGEDVPVTILSQYDHRHPDGSYEFRFELSDGTVRSERGYIIHYQHKNILVVRGYFSYRLPDYRYLTVYYSADQNGYRQDSSTISWTKPHLHRSLDEQDSTATEGNQGTGVESTNPISEDKLEGVSV